MTTSQEANNDEVICPNCSHQFRAIPVNVQRLMLDVGFEPPFMEAPPLAELQARFTPPAPAPQEAREYPPDVILLREALDYDPATGIFLWAKPTPRTRARVGAIAGSVKGDGYVRITIRGREFLAHRAAWMHYYGTEAPPIIDHINQDRGDNRIANLRAADHAENNWNRAKKTSITGAVLPDRHVGWVARIRHRGERLYLGSFATQEEAAAAYQSAATKLRGEFHGDEGYPPLPEPFDKLIGHEDEGACVYSAEQMRSYVDSDRKARQQEAAAWFVVDHNDHDKHIAGPFRHEETAAYCRRTLEMNASDKRNEEWNLWVINRAALAKGPSHE